MVDALAQERLNAYLRSVADVPFEWGVHDCLTFTNDAYRAMYGAGWADDWLGRYMDGGSPMRRKELKAEFGWQNITDAINARMMPVKYPPRGALITTKHAQRWITGVALGICTGSRGVFLSKSGVLHLPLEYIEKAWINENTV